MKNKKIDLVLRIAAALFAAGVLLFIILATQYFQEHKVYNGADHISDRMKVRDIDGVAYQPKNTVNYLLIGVDKYGGINPEYASYYNTQQADFLAVLSVDMTDKTYSVVHINRDTMVFFKQLGVGNYSYGTTYAQIALSHTEGGGGSVSANNTVDAVSNFLYRIPIDYYVEITMDIIPLLADGVADIISGVEGNGIPVTLQEGQSLDGLNLTSSTLEGNVLTLHGDDALTFVRGRHGVDDQTNVSRMVRQQEFIEGFLALAKDTNMTDAQMLSCYNILTEGDHLFTNASRQDLYSIFRYLSQTNADGEPVYRFRGIFEPEGETQIQNDHVAFIADTDSVKELAIDVFYDRYNKD